MSLEKDYADYSVICERVMQHIITDINDYLKEIELSGQRSPISSVKQRLKTFESTQEKCQRKGCSLDIDSIKERILDIAGIRIVTLFEDDIYNVVGALKARLRLSVIKTKDYVKNPKPNGYRSIHIVARKEFYFNGETYLVPIEIQIRSKAMDLWASIEHELKYKKDTPDPRTEERLKKAADALAAFEQTAIELRDFDPFAP